MPNLEHGRSYDAAPREAHTGQTRPVPPLLRRTADRCVRSCVRWGIHPDAVSYVSVGVAAVAGACFWRAGHHPILLLVAPFFLYLRLWFNMLDGMVARAAGQGGPRGEVVSEAVDRLSDLIIFVGIAHSGLNAILSGYWAAVFALLVSYVRALGHAASGRREFGGLMGKPIRMVLCHAGAWVTLGLIWWHEGRVQWAELTVLDWTCVLIIVGCAQTIALRMARVIRTLHRQASGRGGV